MDTTTLLIIIGGGVLLVIIALIVFSIISGKRKAKKLDENLKKIKQETETFDNDKRIILVEDYVDEKKEESSQEMQEKMFAEGAIEEEYVPEFVKEDNTKESFLNKNFGMANHNKESDYDFEKFMNEHSYSRKVFNKPLLDKIKSLPPDVRMILLGNILDKHND